MTDYEEPAAKISKLEMPPKDQDEEMDEGQEEWLSEGILTDDDYPAGDQDKSDFNVNTSQYEDGDTTPSLPDLEPEDNSLPDNPQTQDNSNTLDSSQLEDESNAQDNLDNQDNSHSQDNMPIEDNTEHDEYSHIDDISQAQHESHDQFNSETLDDSNTQDLKTDAQDESEALNSNSQVNSHPEDNSNAQTEPNVQANSNSTHTQDSQAQKLLEPVRAEQVLDENIEQTLDNFENSQQSEIPHGLGTFLVKKPDVKNADDKKDGSDMDTSLKYSDDDGNDTDELLRMLGEDGQKTKKEVETKKVEQKRAHDSQSSDDDEYIFEGAKMARLKMAKNAILKKCPTKAEPEAMSDGEDESDASTDECVTVKKMFVSRNATNFGAKTAPKKPARDSMAAVSKKMVTVHRRPVPVKRVVTSTPLPKLKSKPEITVKKIGGVEKDSPIKVEKVPGTHKMNQSTQVSRDAIKTKEAGKPKNEPDEIIDEDGFLEEEDDFDLDEDLESEPEKEGGQRIMRPERMDEEVPTDGDSHSEDDDNSLYDELPSSGSDQDDWFTLDVRSERAGDYIPLLGSKAHQFLTAEKHRVTSRLHSLRQNISALNASGRQQADMLRKATLQLAELDAALKA